MPDAYYHLARAYALLGRADDSRAAFERALQCDPEFVPAKVLARRDSGFEQIWAEYETTSGWRKQWLVAFRSMRDKKWREAAEGGVPKNVNIQSDVRKKSFKLLLAA